MTRKRNYILKNPNAPEEDLWAELDDCNLAIPLMRLYCEGENGKQILISLSATMAKRLITVLEEMLEKANSPIEGYVVEKEEDGQVDNN